MGLFRRVQPNLAAGAIGGSTAGLRQTHTMHGTGKGLDWCGEIKKKVLRADGTQQAASPTCCQCEASLAYSKGRNYPHL